MGYENVCYESNRKGMTTINIGFYTCFYGDNNNTAFQIPEIPVTIDGHGGVPHRQLNSKYYYYTNNKSLLAELEDTDWIGIFDDQPLTSSTLDSCMISKRIKAMPNEYLELRKYDYLCYLDSKVNQINEKVVLDLVSEHFMGGDKAILMRQHWYIDNNVWEEFEEAMNQRRYRLEKDKYIDYINSQLREGLNETDDSHCATGFILRDMNHRYINDINKC